ncbi:PAS domain-containing hybrid sensor histidine kinase/response regulator [Hymenobacter nivis]|nr:PAS domain-containing hybrid sensor histidine kinase/response regulator [Hymenobacter nivis]
MTAADSLFPHPEGSRHRPLTQAVENTPPDQLPGLVQELQTHQLELQMQYESLLLAQADAEANRVQYEDLYEHAPVGFVTLGPHGGIAQLNRTASQLLGTGGTRLAGRPFALFVTPGHRADFADFLARVLASPAPQHTETELRRANGTAFYAQLEAVREEPLPPQGPGCRLALFDTTDRREAANALANSEARFQMLAESVPGVLFEWRVNRDGEHYVTYVSPRLQECFGMAPAALEQAETFLHPADVRSFRLSLAAAVQVRGPWAFEGRVVVPGQPLRWCRGTAAVTTRDDKGVVYSGLLLDVTASKQLEARLRAATEAAEANVRAKQEFLANMSHEIRTPLHGILGLAEMLAASALAPAQAEHLRLLNGSAQHLLAVLNDVLITARLGAGRLHAAAEAFDLGALLRDCTALLAPEAETRGLALRLNAPPALPRVVGDAHRLRQVLLNLLGNALKFTERGGVELRVQCPAGAAPGRARVAFSVSDSGIGIAPAALDAVFEPFVQAGETTDQHYGGTGLGLSISHSLVALLGGTLRATSELGVGSTFHFALEFDTDQSAPGTAPVAPAPAAKAAPGSAGRALLVEDNPVSSLLAEALLRGWGWAVDAAATGPAAVALFEQHCYDVVLMDLRLPGLDGTAATARLRQHPDPARAATPVLAVTAHAQLDADALRASGFDAYLAKPFGEAALRQALAVARQAPAAAPVPRGPLYDLSAVRQMVGDNESFVRHLVGVFCTSTPPILEALRQALAQADWPALADAAHHLKSSLYGMGVIPLYDAIRELEASEAQHPDPARAAWLVGEVTAVTAEVMAELAQAFPGA